jgi:hypothetical protein
MGDGITDTEEVPAAQCRRVAGVIGCTGDKRSECWHILPEGLSLYGEFLPLAGGVGRARQLKQPITNLYEQEFLGWTESQAEPNEPGSSVP